MEAMPALEADIPADLEATASVEVAAGGEGAATGPEAAADELAPRDEVRAAGPEPMPVSRPSLLAPINAARRSLASILARRRMPVAPETDAAVLAVEPEPVATDVSDIDETLATAAVAAIEPAEAGSAYAAISGEPELTGVRQRLVQLISERSGAMPTSLLDEDMTVEVLAADLTETDQVEVASIAVSVLPEVVIDSLIPEPVSDDVPRSDAVAPDEAASPLDPPASIETTAPEAQLPVEEVVALAIDGPSPDLTEPARSVVDPAVACEPAYGAPEDHKIASTLDDPVSEPPRRKRPRRASRRKPAAKKRRSRKS
jgi:hypothetical protein